MKRKWGLGVAAVLFVVLVCLTTTLLSPNTSAASTERERYLLLGTIKNIDSRANTITVRLFDGTDKTLRLGKRLTVNGREETMNRAESRLLADERAAIYYANKGGDETAVDVESLNHVMRKTVTGTLISADKGNMKLVMRTAKGKEEIFRLQNDAAIETVDGVMTFAQFDPQPNAQITLHYEDPVG
jgi:hypothetical protein